MGIPIINNGRARNFARGVAEGHIPRQGGGLGVGKALGIAEGISPSKEGDLGGG